ncbi:MAG: hypothetical protein ABIK23_02280 [candidate division WOR-3 bacterium]
MNHKLPLLTVGGLGLSAQLILLRELFAVFAGNELSSGVFLSFWLLSEGLGAWILGRLSERIRGRETGFLVWLGLFSALISVFGVIGVTFSRTVLGLLPGEGLNLFSLVLVSGAVVFLPAASHGGLFVLCAQIFSRFESRTGVSRAYFYEGLGTVLAALLSYFLLLSRIPGLGIVALFAGLFLVALGFYQTDSFVPRTVFIGLGAVLLAMGVGPAQELQKRLEARVWQGQVVLGVKESGYGKIVSLEREGQRLLLYDGSLVMGVPLVDLSTFEELVSLPMVLHPEPKRVLVLGQALGGFVSEVLKWQVEEVKVVEIDRVLVDEIRRAGGGLVERELSDPRLELVIDDPRRFLASVRDSFDLIVLVPAAPENLSANRLFSEGFFRLCAARLKGNGLFVTRTPGATENLQPEAGAILGMRVTTLKRVFPEVQPIGLDFPMVIAARKGLDLNPESLMVRLSRAGVDLTFLTPLYLASLLEPFRQEAFLKRVIATGEINSDLKPNELFFNMVREGRRSSTVFKRFYARVPRMAPVWLLLTLIVILIVGIAGSLLRGRFFSRGLGILTSGFAGAGISTLAILLYQVRFGSVYSGVALLLAGFMFGTVAGAWLSGRMAKRVGKGGIGGILFLVAELTLVAILGGLLLLGFCGGKAIFVFVLFIAGMCLGWQFGIASIEMQKTGVIAGGRTAGFLSVLDFTGGALGGISTALFLIPVLGLIGAGFFLTSLKVVSAICQSWQRTLA